MFEGSDSRASRAERSEAAKQGRGRGEAGEQGGPRSPSGEHLSHPSFAGGGVPFSGFSFHFSGSSFSMSSLIDFSNACSFQSVKSGPPRLASAERPRTFRGSP